MKLTKIDNKTISGLTRLDHIRDFSRHRARDAIRIKVAQLLPESSSYFTNPRLRREFAMIHFPLGLGTIAGVLKMVGRQFSVYDSNAGGTTEEFLEITEREKPDVILLSGLLGDRTYPFVKSLTKRIKENSPTTKIVIGGPMATTIPELLISRISVDFVVTGEGERTIIELLDAIEQKKDFGRVNGIYFKSGSSANAVFTGERERIADLDRYPFPDYEAFPMKPYMDDLERTGRSWQLCVSRGCYNRCHFCKITFGQKVTSYSCRSVVDHMDYVRRKYGYLRFSFVDDNFLNSPKMIEEFVDVLKGHPQKFKWRFQGRADRITPELAEKMARVGLFDINFGIESGSQEMLNRYGKNLDIKKAFKNLMAVKGIIDIHATFIAGGPGENWDTIKETERFIRKLKLNNAKVSVLTLFPGTVFYERAVKSGLIRNEEEYCMNIGPAFDRPYVNISDLSDSDVIKARDGLLQTAAQFGKYT